MRVEHAPGGFDHVGLGQSGDDILRRELVLQHPRRIQPHDIFAVLGADDFDAIDAGDPMQARHQIVLRDIGQFGQVAHPRAQTDVE